MADIEPPSFSLGLDLDAHPYPPEPNPLQQSAAPGPSPDDRNAEEEEEGFGLQVMDSEEEEVDGDELGVSHFADPGLEPDSTRVFKRLRRGPVMNEEARVKKKRESDEDDDDEIEDCFSEDDFITDARRSTQHSFVCTSSKVPLHGTGVLTTQSSIRQKEKKKELASDRPASSSLERGHNGLMFPKLTMSPLRRFQLIDSDSDFDTEKPSIHEDVSTKSVKENSSSVEQQSIASEQKRKLSLEKHPNEDLWKDFCPIKSFHVPTPILDEVCEEYFQSLQNKNAAQKQGNSFCSNESIDRHKDALSIAGFDKSWSSADPLLPAHHYFFHDDPRIQKLVRSRLPNFSPIGVHGRGNKLPTEPVIDYMTQFNGGANKQKGTQRGNSEKGSTRRRGKLKISSANEISNVSQGWVDPKSTATIPKDAGKRRVHANGQPAGRWFTSPEGKKVYVSRTGQELTGQSAYRHYKKDNGGFRKSKRKTNAKRKKKG